MGAIIFEYMREVRAKVDQYRDKYDVDNRPTVSNRLNANH